MRTYLMDAQKTIDGEALGIEWSIAMAKGKVCI